MIINKDMAVWITISSAILTSILDTVKKMNKSSNTMYPIYQKPFVFDTRLKTNVHALKWTINDPSTVKTDQARAIYLTPPPILYFAIHMHHHTYSQVVVAPNLFLFIKESFSLDYVSRRSLEDF